MDIQLKLPEAAARLQILRIHTRTLTARLAPDVRLGRIAAATATFSGADLSGVVRSAASFALRLAASSSGVGVFAGAARHEVLRQRRSGALAVNRKPTSPSAGPAYGRAEWRGSAVAEHPDGVWAGPMASTPEPPPCFRCA